MLTADDYEDLLIELSRCQRAALDNHPGLMLTVVDSNQQSINTRQAKRRFAVQKEALTKGHHHAGDT